MVKQITVRQTGTSVSATIPPEMAERLHIERGDRVFAIETADGVLLTPYDAIVDEAMNAYRQVAKRYGGALRELARQRSGASFPARERLTNPFGCRASR